MPGYGELLREARLSRGLTYEYISQIIKIRPEFLEALEDENLAALPGNFYAKNFLRRYADFLGLDSGRLVEEFVMRENAARGQVEVPGPAQLSANPAPDTRPHRRANFGMAAALAVLLLASLALVARAFLSGGDRLSSNLVASVPTPTNVRVAALPTVTSPPVRATSAPTRGPAARKPTSTATRVTLAKGPAKTTRRKVQRTPTRAVVRDEPSTNREENDRPKATATPRPTKTPTSEPTSAPTEEPTRPPKATRTPRPTSTPESELTGEVVASVRTQETSEVLVKSDGRTVFSGSMRPGRTETFTADTNLYVYSDSAPDVFVSVNECTRRSLDSFGCPGCREAYFNFPRTYYDCRQ